MMRLGQFIGRIAIVIAWIAVITVSLLVLSGYHLFPPDKEITVFAWGDMFDEDIIAEFERDTGIKVNLSFYSSNEELLVKLRALDGYGYDLVVPSDYVVEKVIREGLVQPIDKRKLDFYEHLNPVLLGHFFDPENRYAIPFEWEIYGIGINDACKEQVDQEESPWTCIFEPDKTFLHDDPHSVAMTNDPVEAITFAAQYLFDDVQQLDDDQQDAVQRLLQKQQRWVEAYSNDRSAYYLATNNCCISLLQSSLMWRAMRKYNNISFYLPEDNGFVTVEHCVIPIGSERQDLVYQFLNYIYSKQSFTRHFNTFAFIPARYDVIEDLQASQKQKSIMRSSQERFNRFHFIRDIVPDEVKNRMWVEIKS